jgi:uncharacterized integral membrane protein
MKASTLIVLVSLAAATASVVVANRDNVTFKLVPFVQDDSPFTLVTPLYLLVFLTFLLGVVIGAATVGLRSRRNARKKRLAAKEAEKRLALDAARVRGE